MGTFTGPGTNGQVVTITSSQPVTGKYVVIQLKQESQYLNLNEVKATVQSSSHGSGTVLILMIFQFLSYSKHLTILVT